MITELRDIHHHTTNCVWWLTPMRCDCAASFRNQADGHFTEQDDAIQEQGGAA
jgi:hypothetical protein